MQRYAKIYLILGLLLIPGLAKSETTILAGGCFWCMESDFEKLDGVSEVVSGFTGGHHPDPTYNGSHDGHYEAVEIEYDPEKISYEQLIEHYWRNIDPFDDGGQFCDRGHSYKAAIFVKNEKERRVAAVSLDNVIAKFPDKKVVTPIFPASEFFPIKGDEIVHQNFYKNNPLRYKFYRKSCGRDARLEEIWGPDES